ncbi:PadR family transcriptional regulator [Streptomyces sp. NPDC090046]|uniref:PadR family transcriptional regulator n=1 Tax=Streptomyces sp. NPDC090046 TaxID=3365928 RepID=UPI0037F6CC24
MAPREMTRTAFYVLTALADEPRHGYGIVRETTALSEGQVELRIGTLYGVLDRLTAEGVIELDREETHQGRLRKYYRLTGRGEAALESEARRMASGAQAATRRLASRIGARQADGNTLPARPTGTEGAP